MPRTTFKRLRTSEHRTDRRLTKQDLATIDRIDTEQLAQAIAERRRAVRAARHVIFGEAGQAKPIERTIGIVREAVFEAFQQDTEYTVEELQKVRSVADALICQRLPSDCGRDHSAAAPSPASPDLPLTALLAELWTWANELAPAALHPTRRRYLLRRLADAQAKLEQLHTQIRAANQHASAIALDSTEKWAQGMATKAYNAGVSALNLIDGGLAPELKTELHTELPEGAETKACPFCGGQPTIEPWHGGGPEKHMVACDNDDCEVAPQVTGETKQEAIANWNRRSPSKGGN